MPAGMTMMSASRKAFLAPSSAGRWPLIFCAETAKEPLDSSLAIGLHEALVVRSSPDVTHRLGRYVGQIGSDAGSVDDIIKGEIIDEGARLEQ